MIFLSKKIKLFYFPGFNSLWLRFSQFFHSSFIIGQQGLRDCAYHKNLFPIGGEVCKLCAKPREIWLIANSTQPSRWQQQAIYLT
jgi:hypothetical protein